MRMLKKGSLSSFELGNSAIFLQHARLARNRGGAALELQSAVCRDALTLMEPLLCAGLGHTLCALNVLVSAVLVATPPGGLLEQAHSHRDVARGVQLRYNSDCFSLVSAAL